ncbi:head GIN domain-containing protein [Pontibacter mangrovi]|uniref:DUF2807 domain-containing protein n=1 Tax=Pontibacter mangrovi TaxID=2589816 RepID=A0A501W3K2_9BACT|nr:head GIN domain-containing protein [Pontibacter mangrovi]TPE44493.1 DUF2807 domain-containing protein [Pontibacter mangrovi]
MKLLKLPLPVLVFLLLFSSCDGGYCLEGEGDVESRTLQLAPLSGVEVSGSTKVYIKQGSTQRVEVRGQANVLDELETKVRNGVWDIGFERCLRRHETVEVYLTLPEITEANINGSGAITLEDVFRSRRFKSSVSGSGKVLLRLATENLQVRISGSGTIRAAGVADAQEVSVSGSGKYNALDLNCREAEVSISGSGSAEVDPEELLEAEISGSGKVYYTGNPEVVSEVSGSGKVVKM